jgi:hypothetical protein
MVLVIRMDNIRGNIKSLKNLIFIWIVAIGFAAVMFTIGLIYDIGFAIIIAGVISVFSLIGIIYSASLVIRLENHLKYLEFKANS